MAKRRARINTAQQLNLLGGNVGPGQGYPKSIPEAIERGDRMVQAVTIRNARQTALLNRASELMKTAVDECHCGGVERAIEQHTGSLIQKGDGDGEGQAPDAEGD